MAMKTELISSMIVARAEPKPIRLASPTMFCVTKVAINSNPLRPLLMTQTRSKARRDSMTETTRTMMLIDRRQNGEDDLEEGGPLVGSVDLGRLQLPDEADERQRQHDRQIERRLINPRPAHLLVEQHRQEHPERGGDQEGHGQPDQVVSHGPPERRVDRRHVVRILQTQELGVTDRADAIPVVKESKPSRSPAATPARAPAMSAQRSSGRRRYGRPPISG